MKADGTGTITLEKADWTIDDDGAGDIADKAIVIHEKVDDFGQPTGNAGGRIGCGVIEFGSPSGASLSVFAAVAFWRPRR